jgi:DNA-binding NarL/FixJ family response regulator
MVLSPETIKVCIKTILVKLDAQDQTHAGVMAIQRGFTLEFSNHPQTGMER